MTKRQKMLGVSDYGYQRGIKDSEFLADCDAFLAKAATIKKGEYRGSDIVRAWFPEYADMPGFINCKLEQAIPYFLGLTAAKHEHFNYTCTNGLDTLTVK